MIFERVEKLRRDKGITQEELAKIVGFTREGFRNSLKNNKFPVDALEKLAQYFNKPISSFFDGEEHNTINQEGINNAASFYGDATIGNLASENRRLKEMLVEKDKVITDKEKYIVALEKICGLNQNK